MLKKSKNLEEKGTAQCLEHYTCPNQVSHSRAIVWMDRHCMGIYRHSDLLFIGGVDTRRSGLCGGGVLGAHTEVFLAYKMIPEGLGFGSNTGEWREGVLYKGICP